MYTVEEANEKWCPFGTRRVPYGDPGVVDPEYITDAIMDSPCIADKCMAWRDKQIPRTDGSVKKVGYCGLAGKP